MHQPTIYIKKITLAYANQTIFSNLSFTLPAGRWVGLLGTSGVGKSTLLRLIANLPQKDQLISGQIEVDNHLPISEQVAFMPQSDLLLPWLSVLENALIRLKLKRTTHAQKKAERDKAINLLSQVGLEKTLHQYPHQLSGGMRQRVSLVRTLMEDKPIVLMDEPFSALDAITRYKLQNLAADLLKDKTVLFVTHDPTEALRLANDIYILQGKPAILKKAVSLEDAMPRSLADQAFTEYQSRLFNELSAGVEE